MGVQFSNIALTNADASAGKLVNIIEEIASVNKPCCIVSANEIKMPEEFSIISITKTTSHSSCLWRVYQSGWPPNIDESTIQAAISKKNKKIGKYRVNANEVWLLLIMDQIYLSGSFHVTDIAVSHIYDSVFNKTILFSCIDKKFWILSTKTPK